MRLGRCLLAVSFLSWAFWQPAHAQGTVVVYTSMKASLMDELKKGFQKQNPDTKLDYFASGAGSVMTRLASERDAGKRIADVLWHSEVPDFLKLKAEGLLEPYQSPEARNIRSTFMDGEYHWTPARLGTLGIAYNKRKIRKIPQNWADLNDRSFRWKFGIANPSLSGTSFMSSLMLVNRFGWGFFENLKANELRIGQGSVQVVDDTASGLISACIAVDYIVLDKIRGGANLGFIYPPEMLVIPSPAALLKGGANLPGAKRFMDYLLSREGQTIIAHAGTLPARSDIALSKEMLVMGVGSVDEAIKRALFLEYSDSAQVRTRFLKKFETLMRSEAPNPHVPRMRPESRK